MSQVNYSENLTVTWVSSTVGNAGPFSPPSGEKCVAYAHSPGSQTPLPGGIFSYVAL